MDEAQAGTAAESDDPFAHAGDNDPFADQAGDPGPPAPPVVNKEGEPVEPQVETPAEGEGDGTVQPLPATETPEATPEPPAVAEAAPAPAQEPPAPAQEPKGTSPMRQYHILYQTGPNQWTEAEWAGDGGGKTKIVQARNNDHALRQAFVILGQPKEGVTVLPVPVSGFKPKRLKPKEVVPRTALDIS